MAGILRGVLLAHQATQILLWIRHTNSSRQKGPPSHAEKDKLQDSHHIPRAPATPAADTSGGTAVDQYEKPRTSLLPKLPSPSVFQRQLELTCYRWTSGTAGDPSRPLSPPPPPWPTPSRMAETSAEPPRRSLPKSRTRFAAAAVASPSAGESSRWILIRRLLLRWKRRDRPGGVRQQAHEGWARGRGGGQR